MSKKHISIKTPNRAKIPDDSEEWVKQREKHKRLTFDAPSSLHSKLKIASAKTGQKMGELAISAISEYLTKIEI
ncbi:MAG: hypothetical protein KDK96_11055 [Chlamydiia bacterium]|nr:hypothetical protein [Simkania sp.]MCB1073618.1 hypothetical protein [Chlamydiia bacterium]MCB9027479.1 hypothetical protein [Pseudobdellovibrionaceae bacterium]